MIDIFIIIVIICNVVLSLLRRPQWPRGLTLESTVARLALDRVFESHQGHRCLSLMSVVCCQVEVSATS